MNNDDNKKRTISIGGLAAGSGVPVETVRNWELRYNFPNPIRLDSGHRRYPMELISQLKKIKSLVDLGYKPSFAVNLEDNELDKLLMTDSNANPIDPNDTASIIGRWIILTEALNVSDLSRSLAKEWNQIGARRFIFELAIPFLREVGNRWEASEFSVAHEHFASEVLQSFLASRWRPLISANHKRKIVLANQEGDLHSLGLQMSAVLCTLHNIEPIFLGPNTPLQDIIIAATEQKTNGVVIGLSAVSDPNRSAAFLETLKKGLLGVRIAFGGNNQLPNLSNIEYIATLQEFDTWCQNI